MEALFRIRERRNRFIFTCLRGSPFANQEELFENDPQGSLYEPRWSAVLEFLEWVETVLPVLTQSWDHGKYLAGGQDVPDSRPEQARVEARQESQKGLAAFDPFL